MLVFFTKTLYNVLDYVFINNYLLCILFSPLVASVQCMMVNTVVDNVDVVVCHQVPVLALLVGGGWEDELLAVRDRVRSKLPVLVIRQSGGAADIIADAVDRDDRGERSVFQHLYRCLH